MTTSVAPATGLTTTITAGSIAGTATIEARSILYPSVYETIQLEVTSSVIPVDSVTLSPKTMSLELGQGEPAQPSIPTVTPTVLPADASQSLDWTSSNSAAVSVNPTTGVLSIPSTAAAQLAANSGTVTVTITAKSTDYPAKLDTCTVTLTYAKVTAIKVNNGLSVNKTLLEGASKNFITDEGITVTMEPDGYYDPATTVSWALDPSTSTVLTLGPVAGDYTVVGTNGQTVDVIVTPVPNPNSVPPATINVTITDTFTAVTSVTIANAGASTIKLDEFPFSGLSATVLPSGATNPTLSWSVSGSAAITASSGGVLSFTSAPAVLAEVATAGGNLSIVVTAAATDGSGEDDTINLTVQYADVTDVYLNGSAAPAGVSLVEGTSGTFTYASSVTVLPSGLCNDAVTWSSSSTDINVSANDGTYTIGASTASVTPVTITVTSVANPGISVSFDVTIIT
jgi:uncharacterized protein YjdB